MTIQSIVNTKIKEGTIPTAASLNPNGVYSDSAINDIINSATNAARVATSERLYVVEPRSAQGRYDGDAYNNRGPTASIKLINTNNNLEGAGNTDKRYTDSGLKDGSVYRDLLGITNNAKGYDRFLLTSCDVSYSEKVQIMTTFGDNEVVYYFGKNPVIMNLQGILIDSLTNDWFGSFIKLYQTFLRGTQLAKNFEMLELVLPNMKVIGSILSLSHQQNSARDTDIPFSMQFYAKQITMLPQPSLGNFGAQNLLVSGSGIFNTSPNRQTPGASLTSSALPSSVSINGEKYAISGTAGGFTEPSWLSNPGKLTDVSNQIATGYTWFRNNISSPIVSVIASLTKVIQVITKDISKIISSFTDPINAVLRDIINISTQATAVALLVENSAGKIGHLLATPSINLRNTLASLKSTAGVITRLPENVSDAFKRNYHIGKIGSSAAILSSGPQGSVKKTAVLSSGAAYTVQNSFII